jgi:hypothetical protein
MPNFDTGHYFLTTLAPIKNGTTPDKRGVSISFTQAVRIQLASLPTALQSPATEEIGINSPFARNRHTHLCRFMVLDDVVYNGRIAQDVIVSSLGGRNPIVPQEVDRLNCAYLMFVADIDAVMEDGAPLPATLSEAEQNKVRDAYALRLWETMELEIREIYDNCVGFENVQDADGFADYIRRCQVETTMPFNDYWLNAPKLKGLSVLAIAALVGIPVVVMLLGLIGWLFHMAQPPILGVFMNWTSGMTILGGLLSSLLAIAIAYAYVMWVGKRPMPPGEYADLPAVLKSLYLQQTFADFAVSAQGNSDAELHEAFGRYLQEHKPDDKSAPTQVPGVIAIDRNEAVLKTNSGT